MDLSNLFKSVADAITRHNDPNQPDYPQSNLPSFVENLFRQHSAASHNPAEGAGGTSVLPASQDQYGDPGVVAGRNVRPASADPYGDPADQR